MRKISLIVLLAGFMRPAGAQIAWTETTIQSTIDGAYALSAADINGDGKIDVVGSALQDTDLYWWSNTAGDGSSWTRTTIASSGTWQAVETADIDGDGDVDVVGADPSTEDIAWFINNSGDGSSWTQVTIDGSFTDAIEVAVGDIDGDGDLDVAGAALGDNLISWWANDGSPSGANWAETTVVSSFDAAEVHLADIDGDGDLDVIGIDGEALDDIAWFENNGSGGGWTKTDIDTSFDGGRSAQAEDIDGDGDLDILAVASIDDIVTWFENTAGDGSAWTERVIDASFDDARYAVGADVDRDGDMDVLASASVDGSFNWYENLTGAGTSWTEHEIGSNASPVWIWAADIDGDGDQDVIGSGAGSADEVIWWENSQLARASSVGSETTVTSTVTDPGFLEVVDLDGDGDLDLLGVDGSEDDVYWWQNTAGDGSAWSETTIKSLWDNTNGVTAADIDGDGDLDVVASAINLGDVSWFENDGTPAGGSWNETSIDASFTGAFHVDVGDMDGDGDIDVLGVAKDLDQAVWWANNGSGGGWTETTVNSAIDFPVRVHAADVDGDGDLDVIAAAILDGDVLWWANNGSGGGWSETAIDTAFLGAFGIDTGDIDGDGDLDVLGGARDDDDVVWWANNGSGGGWTETAIDSDFDGVRDVFLGDFDADGDLDAMASALNAGDVSWWENTAGDGSAWTEHAIDASFSNALGATAGDIDGDGDLDFVAGSQLPGSVVTWWANDTIILNQGFVISGTAGTANNTGWRLLSAPCASQTRATLDNYLSSLQDDEVRRYDESAGSGDARWLNTASTDGLTQGTGYAAYLYDDATQEVGADFGIAFPSCTTTNADVVVSTLDVNEEWFLAGNPYMQAFDLSSFSGTGFQTTYKLWNPSTTSYTNVTAAGGSADVIPVGQGFFVQRTTVGAGGTSVTYDDAGKTSGGTLVAKGGETDYGRIPLKLEVEDSSGLQLSNDESASLLIAEDATLTWDRYESGKLTPLVDQWATVALVGDRAGRDEALSLLSLPTVLHGAVTVPLQIDQSGVAGRATLSWEGMVGVPDDWQVHLLDADTGFSQDLRRVTNYTFELSESAGKVEYAKGVALSASGAPRLALVITPASATGTEGSELPAAYELQQNYPNPFNPETMIRFALPEAGAVSLTVYDAMGREVQTLLEGTRPAGWHEVKFDGRRLATGVYLYRLNTPNGDLIKTMSLIR